MSRCIITARTAPLRARDARRSLSAAGALDLTRHEVANVAVRRWGLPGTARGTIESSRSSAVSDWRVDGRELVGPGHAVAAGWVGRRG